VAVVVPIIMLALTVAVGEFVTSRRQHISITDAMSTAVYFFLDGIQSFIMGILLTQAGPAVPAVPAVPAWVGFLKC